MAVVKRPNSTGRKAHRVGRPHGTSWGAILIFSMLILAAPLAFGAVDRIVQIALAIIFAVGLLLHPPAPISLSRRQSGVLLGLLVLLVVKEFAPSSWFGSTPWRTALEESYAIRLLRTHHPEPGRAFDAFLAAGLGACWFLWVRTLGACRETRIWLAWLMVAAALVVAVVSFATRSADPVAIYGLRFTPGWQGFGPFPNRNHTASFLAMGALIGAGCVVWAGIRRHRALVCFGAASIALILAALFETGSRGGLVSFVAGGLVFAVLVLSRLRSRRAIGVTLAALLVACGFTLAFGSSALQRFSSSGAEVSNLSRVHIWKDALTLWRDAPLLGHGISSFTSIFPLRQTLALDNQVILHPESSWVQWLVELGAVPLGVALLLVLVLMQPYVRALFERQSSFFLIAGALAAVSALAVHSLIDVPGHRWGTMALALAALALVCPSTRDTGSFSGTRKMVLLPLAVALFWTWPFLYDEPAWSPSTLARALDRAQLGGESSSKIRALLTYFPLNSKLHQLVGAQQLRSGGRLAPEWEQHFQIAARLSPGSWATPIYIAGVCRPYSPGHTLHYWQMALDRAGWRRDELFGRALTETEGVSGATITWANYVESHPELLLIFARTQPSAESRDLFESWWSERAGDSDLTKGEVEAFYQLAERYASVEQLRKWIELHPERQENDFWQLARLLHVKGDNPKAWELLMRGIPEPAFPQQPPRSSVTQLETIYRMSPDNLTNAQSLAHARSLAGDEKGALEIVLEVAQREMSPVWFRQKAAYLLERAGRTSEAVAILIKENP